MNTFPQAPGLLGLVSSFFRFYSLSYLSMADFRVLSATSLSPFFVLIVGHFLIGDKANWMAIVASLLVIVATVLSYMPPMLTGMTLNAQFLVWTSFLTLL